jgi:hypothetical protein
MFTIYSFILITLINIYILESKKKEELMMKI